MAPDARVGMWLCGVRTSTNPRDINVKWRGLVRVRDEVKIRIETLITSSAQDVATYASLRVRRFRMYRIHVSVNARFTEMADFKVLGDKTALNGMHSSFVPESIAT